MISPQSTAPPTYGAITRWAEMLAGVFLAAALAVGGCASSGDSKATTSPPEPETDVEALAEACADFTGPGEGVENPTTTSGPWNDCDQLARVFAKHSGLDPRHAVRVYGWTCRQGAAAGCRRGAEWGRTLSGRKRYRDLVERGCRLGDGLACKRSLHWTTRFSESETMRAMRVACRDGVPSMCPRLRENGHRSDWVERVDEVGRVTDVTWRRTGPASPPVWGTDPTVLYAGFASHLWECRLDECVDEGFRRRPFGPVRFHASGTELQVRRVRSGAIVQLVRTPGGWFVWRPFEKKDPVQLEGAGDRHEPLAIGPYGESILGLLDRGDQSERPSVFIQWSTESGERRVRDVESADDHVEDVAFGRHPAEGTDDSRVALAYDNSLLELREWPSLKLAHRLDLDDEPLAVTIGPHGRRMAANFGGQTRLYALSPDEKPKSVTSVSAEAPSAFGPNGRIWAVPASAGLDLRAHDDGRRLAPTIRGVGDRMAFSPSGRHLAVEGDRPPHVSLVSLRADGADDESTSPNENRGQERISRSERKLPDSIFEPPAVTLRGRVVRKSGEDDEQNDQKDENGSPIEGAEVTFAPDEPRAPEGRAETGPNGRFTIEGLHTGEGELKARAVGHHPNSRSLRLEGDEDVSVELEPAAVVRGRVTKHDGSPAAGARVVLRELESPDPRTHRYETTADDEGRFVFGHVDAAVGDFRADRRTYRLKSWHGDSGVGHAKVVVDAVATFERDVDLGSPDDPTLLRVRVTTETGRPLSGADVRASADLRRGTGLRIEEKFGATWDMNGKTDSRGWWMTDRAVASQKYEFNVEAFDDYWSVEPETVTTPNAPVVRATVAGGKIRVAIDEESLQNQWSELRLMLARTEALTRGEASSEPGRRMNPEATEDGSTRVFHGLAKGRWTMVTCALEHQHCGIRTIELDADETRRVTARTRGGGRSLTGRIRAAGSGVPLADVTVATHRIRLPGEEHGDFDHEVRTDPTGRFRLDGLAPGSHRLEIRADGLRRRILEVDVPAGEGEDDSNPVQVGTIDVWTEGEAP